MALTVDVGKLSKRSMGKVIAYASPRLLPRGEVSDTAPAHENIMRFGHWDKELTKQYRKEGRFEDRNSKVLVRRDGTLRIVLAGIDKSRLRSACLARDGYDCVDRGDGHKCHGPLQMSHWPPMSKSEGSDVLNQVFTRCWRAHILLDGHGKPVHF